MFRERFFLALLRSPRQLRNALIYVLRNGRKHGEVAIGQDDPCSSIGACGGRDEGRRGGPGEALEPVIAGAGASIRDRVGVSPARTWLMRVGWWLHGGGGLRAWEEPVGSAGRR